MDKRCLLYTSDLIEAYKPTAEKEVKEVEALAKKLEGEDFKMEPWDFGFYSHKLQICLLYTSNPQDVTRKMPLSTWQRTSGQDGI